MDTEQAQSKPEKGWGSPPDALVPAILRSLAGDMAAPSAFHEGNGAKVCLRDLDSEFWQRGHEPGKKGLDQLAQALGTLLKVHVDQRIVEDAGIPSIPLAALCLPLISDRIFSKSLPDGLIDCETLTIGDLLKFPRVGPKRTLEFMCALDAVIADAYRKPLPDLTATDVSERRKSPRTPREIKTFFRVLSAWAAGERGEQTLKNALPEPHPSWPPELVQLWKRVKFCSAPELAGQLVDRYSVPRLIAHAFEDSDSRHRVILQARVFATESPTSLDSLARAFDVSAAEITNIQRQALKQLERLQSKPYRSVIGRSRVIRRRLGSAIPQKSAAIPGALDWAVADFDNGEFSDFARSLIFWLAGPYRLQHGWYVAAADLPIRTTRALMQERDTSGVIATDAVRRVLNRLGIRSRYHELWIDRLGEFIGVEQGLMSTAQRMTGHFPQLPTS